MDNRIEEELAEIERILESHSLWHLGTPEGRKVLAGKLHHDGLRPPGLFPQPLPGKIEEVAEKCSRALTYYDRQNLEYEIERQYKISKGYDKLGFDWAFTDEDRRDMRWQKEEAVEWILLLEVIPIICQPFPQPLLDEPFSTRCGDCPDLHFEMRCSVAHRTEHLWKCGVLGVELIKNDAHGVRKHHDCPRLQFPQPLDDKEFIKELADLLLKMDIGSLDAPTSVKQEGVEAVAKYKANKLYSALLQPKIEEARKELLKYIEENIFNLCEVCACKESKDWQALSGKGGESNES